MFCQFYSCTASLFIVPESRVVYIPILVKNQPYAAIIYFMIRFHFRREKTRDRRSPIPTPPYAFGTPWTLEKARCRGSGENGTEQRSVVALRFFVSLLCTFHENFDEISLIIFSDLLHSFIPAAGD